MQTDPLEDVLSDRVITEALRSVTGKAVTDESFAEELERVLQDEVSRQKLVGGIQACLSEFNEAKTPELQPSSLRLHEWRWNEALQKMAEDDEESLGADVRDVAPKLAHKYVYLPHHVLSVAPRVSPRELGFDEFEWKPYTPSEHSQRVLKIVSSALMFADRQRHRWFFKADPTPTAILQPSSDEAGKVELAFGKDAYKIIYLADATALYLVFSSRNRHRISLDADPRALYEIVVGELNGKPEVAEVALESIQKAFALPGDDAFFAF
jgi:hypothetical protein